MVHHVREKSVSRPSKALRIVGFLACCLVAGVVLNLLVSWIVFLAVPASWAKPAGLGHAYVGPAPATDVKPSPTWNMPLTDTYFRTFGKGTHHRMWTLYPWGTRGDSVG